MRYFVIFIGCFLFSLTALADPTAGGSSAVRKTQSGNWGSSTSSASSDIKASNNQIGFQSISTDFDYTEIGNGRLGTATGTMDTEIGTIGGNAFYISVMNDSLFGNDYFNASYDHSTGLTNYVGGTINPPTPYGSVVDSHEAILTNYSARYGRGFEARNSSMLTPYIEFGAHRWDRRVNFGELYTNLYYGLGLMSQNSLGYGAVLTVDLMYGQTSQSNIVVNSGGTAPNQVFGFSGALGNSYLYKVGISLDYAFFKLIHATLGLDYTAFNYGISGIYPSGTFVSWEPDSKSNFTTARLGLGWGF